MRRELVMAGLSIGAVIVVAWLVDHPRKEWGSVLALGAFALLVIVVYFKNKNTQKRKTRSILKRNRRMD